MVSRKKILVVEDNVLNRSLLCQILAGQMCIRDRVTAWWENSGNAVINLTAGIIWSGWRNRSENI